MAQVLVNFRVEQEDKERMESVCKELGLSMSAALTIFMKKVGREHRIPFEVSSDPFYSAENMERLKTAIEDAKAGRRMTEHEPIEVDE